MRGPGGLDGTVPSGELRERDDEAAGKPWLAVVDSGVLYDSMARMLEAAGIPVFRTADRALRLLAVWAGARLGA